MHAIPPGYSPVWVLSGPPRDSTQFGFCLGVFSFLGFHFYIAACIFSPHPLAAVAFWYRFVAGKFYL